MGYQESYLKPENKRSFDKLLNRVKENGKEYYKSYGCYPVEIITFTKNHYPFKKGDKCIYLVGERYPQEHYEQVILRQGNFAFLKEWENNLHEEDERDVWDFKEYKEQVLYDRGSRNCIKCHIEFTEEVDPKGIWADSGEITDVEHERIVFE